MSNFGATIRDAVGFRLPSDRQGLLGDLAGFRGFSRLLFGSDRLLLGRPPRLPSIARLRESDQHGGNRDHQGCRSDHISQVHPWPL
jgi:hypothetical protein